MKIKEIIKKLRALFFLPIYRFNHNKIKTTTYIRDSSGIKNSTIGDYCWINRYVGMNHVVMGNYCSIATHVLIGGMEHSVNFISTSARLSSKCYSDRITHIGNDVWIGSQVVIKQGISIGNGAVVGANSFVNKDVPPYAIVVGSPAKIIKYRFSKELIDEIEKSHYWDYKPDEAKQIIKRISNKYNLIDNKSI